LFVPCRYQKEIAYGHHLSPLKKRIRENLTPRRGDDSKVGNEQSDGSENCVLNNLSIKVVDSLDETHQLREDVINSEICAVSASSETDKEQTTSGRA
jgi:hypothetical protein